MKRLIVLSVIFALVAGGLFAMDVSGTTIGNINVMESSTADGAVVSSSANLSRVRLEGSGENDDSTFGVWVRVDGLDTILTVGDLSGKPWEGSPYRAYKAHGYAWWKPIDQFKLLIGGNPDGFFGKEGVTAWMFYQTVSDTGVVSAGNAWGGGYGNINFREAFYGGFDGEGALLTISPAEIVDINIVIPFFDGGETSDVFKKTTAQIDLKMDFGNIALTYRGASGEPTDQAKIFASFSGPVGPINLDFGIGYGLAHKAYVAVEEIDDPLTPGGTIEVLVPHAAVKLPIDVGLGVKYAADSFGVKFRAMAALAGDDKSTNILVDVLPYFNINDSITAFVSAGLAMYMPDGGDSVTGWHFNPYLTVGSEWGAKFAAGIRVWSAGGKDAITNWQVPIAIIASF